MALITQGFYNPRKIIELSILGLQDKLIDDQNPNVWLCSTCQKCVELCPQKVELTEIFTLIKNLCFEKGKVPNSFKAQAQAVFDNGIAIPYSNAILARRKQFDLPEIKTASIDDVQKLLKGTDFERNLLRGGQE